MWFVGNGRQRGLSHYEERILPLHDRLSLCADGLHIVDLAVAAVRWNGCRFFQGAVSVDEGNRGRDRKGNNKEKMLPELY